MLRIDALWVHSNRRLVQAALLASMVAAAASALLIFAGRRRWTERVLWAATVAVMVTVFSDRLPVILQTLLRQKA